MSEVTTATLPVQSNKLVRLDLGCGKNKHPKDENGEWLGVDSMSFPGVDFNIDLTKPWPWDASSVDEVYCSHFLEHLTAQQRIHFANELWRVLKTSSKAQIITPAPFSERAYGDLTHKWPPVTSFWYLYLNQNWRKDNAPHNDFYKCNFDCGFGYNMRDDVRTRNQEYQMFALTNFTGAATDTIVTITKIELLKEV